MNKRKLFILTILCFFIAGTSVGQTQKEIMLRYDSTYIALQNKVKFIYNKYNAIDETYKKLVPDSVAKDLEKTFDLISKRDEEIERLHITYQEKTEEEEKEKLNLYTDSLIALNKIDITTQVRFGLGVNANQGILSCQYVFLLNKYRKFDFGIGSGMEIVIRGQGLVQVIQAPIFITNKYFVSRDAFLNFDYGFTMPISGSFRNSKGETIDYKEADMRNNYYFELGIGIIDDRNNSIQINFRNQSLGVPEPLNQRTWMFGVKVGF